MVSSGRRLWDVKINCPFPFSEIILKSSPRRYSKIPESNSSIATVISEMSVTVYQLFIIHKQLNLHTLFSDLSKYLIAGLVMFLIVFKISLLTPASWIFILLEITVGIIIYVVLLIFLKAEIINKLKFIMHK